MAWPSPSISPVPIVLFSSTIKRHSFSYDQCALFLDKRMGRLDPGETKTIGPMMKGGLSPYSTFLRDPAGTGKFGEFVSIVSDNESRAIRRVMRPHERMERICRERDDTEPCRNLLGEQLTCEQAAVFPPRAMYSFLGDRLILVELREYLCQFAVLFRFVWNDIRGRNRTFEWVIESRRLSCAEGSVAYLGDAGEGSS